jgi:outer membrane protein assembly factor BamB
VAAVAVGVLASLAGLVVLAPSSSRPGAAAAAPVRPAPTVVSAWDWPSYGHDAQHTFHGRTTLTRSTVTQLRQAWFYPTGDAVTATPTVIGDTVYVGSWDDYFYALNFATGALRWKVRLKSQDAITPYPGQSPRDAASDGGLVTAAAWYEPAAGRRPALVIVPGGYTLYALVAATGAIYWEHDYPGVPGPPDPNHDSTRIFSSPVVVGNRVLFGIDEDGQPHSAGAIVAASLQTGDPLWEYQTDVGPDGTVLDNSCGSVWSSGTVLPDLGLVVFGTADCDLSGGVPFADSVLALHIKSGTLAWKFHPLRATPRCDDDFGATANAGVSTAGVTTFLGEGAKNGTYYSLNPRTGRARWRTNVVFGGSSGGFIGTTAYDGQRVYGATGIGDFFPTKHGIRPVCDPSDPRDVESQNPTNHAFAAATGAVAWQTDGTPSFAPTTVAGGMTFNGASLSQVLDVRATSSGALLAQIHLPQFNWSGIATVGNALVFGIGTTADATGSGIEVFTPGGGLPRVPAGG